MNKKRLRITLLLLALLFSTPLAAQSVASVDSGLVSERPNAEGAATQVKIFIYLLDIDQIDDVNQRFSVDMFFRLSWKDSRLALPEDVQARGHRTVSLDEIWTQKGLIINNRGLNTQLPKVADVDAQGNVQCRQRVYGKLAVNMDLRKFPFDTQVLPIQIVSYPYGPDELQFQFEGPVDEHRSFGAEGWGFKVLQPVVGEFSVAG